jgi:uncharacterized cupin superfamily protein
MNALDAALDFEPVGPDQVVSGSPTTGFAELTDLDGTEIGVWEMTAGTMIDTEADEVFVVIAGSARIEFLDADAASDSGPTRRMLDVRIGDVVHLHAGDRTVWTVTDRIRKVYVTPASVD